MEGNLLDEIRYLGPCFEFFFVGVGTTLERRDEIMQELERCLNVGIFLGHALLLEENCLLGNAVDLLHLAHIVADGRAAHFD